MSRRCCYPFALGFVTFLFLLFLFFLFLTKTARWEPLNQDTLDEPSIDITPSSLVIVEGEPAEFVCRTSVPANIEWERTDGRMNPNATVINGVLRIPAVAFDDTAQYKCIVSTRSVSNDKTVSLHVRPLDPKIQPDIIIYPRKWSGFSGDTVRLLCNTSNPVQRIIWTRTDRMMLPTAATQDNGVLTISNPSVSDAGWYICTATLKDGTERTKSISVQINPRHDMPLATTEPPSRKVPLGSNVVLTCKIINGGGYDWNFQWAFNGNTTLPPNVLVINETLRIDSMQIANRGLYTCKYSQADHGNHYQTTAILDIEDHEMPVLQISHNCTQTLIAGSTVDFLCRPIEGIPEPEVEWSRQDQRPLGPNVQVLAGGMMRITNVTEYDEGAYTCVAQNVVGTTSATVTLKVNSYPNITYT